MFCGQCGTSNADTAAVCVQCGKSLQLPIAAAAMPGGPFTPAPPVYVPNYLVFAILATVFCCLPAGIPAIVFAAQVNAKVQAGDIAGAQAASRNAKMWSWISFGTGLGVIALYMLLVMAGIVSNLHR
jgi:hypothetical protein